MGLLNWFGLGEKRASVNNPSVPVQFADEAQGTIYGDNDTGISLNHNKSLTYGPLYAGINIIGSGVGTMPLVTYERQNPGRRRATEHPVFNVLNQRPNPRMTRLAFFRTLVGHAIIHGNGYALIDRDPLTRVVGQLIVLPPTKTKCVFVNVAGVDIPAFKVEGYDDPFPYWDVIHLPNFGMGCEGLSVVDLFRQSLGLGLAHEKYGAKYYGSGAAVRGILKHPGNPSEKAKAAIVSSWNKLFGGIDNAHKTTLLEEGMEFQQLSLSPEQSQFIEGRKFQVVEWARVLNLPPSKLAESVGTGTYTNIESANLSFVQDSLQPWITALEIEISDKVFTELEKQAYYAEFLVEGRLRADSGARASFYKTMYEMDALTPDEIRERENLNPLENGEGSKTFSQKQAAAKSAPSPQSNDQQPQSGTAPEGASEAAAAPRSSGSDRDQAVIASRRAVEGGYSALLTATVEGQADADATAVRAAVADYLGSNSNVGKFNGWMRGYAKALPATVEDRSRKTFQRYAAAAASLAASELGGEDAAPSVGGEFVDQYVQAFAVRYASDLKRAVLDITEGDDLSDLAQRVLAALEQWQRNAATKAGTYESVRARQAFMREAFKAAGVRSLRWVGSGCCDLCAGLNGRSVAIDQPFVAKGEHVHAVYHGPVNTDCRCEVVAVRGE